MLRLVIARRQLGVLNTLLFLYCDPLGVGRDPFSIRVLRGIDLGPSIVIHFSPGVIFRVAVGCCKVDSEL